MNINANKPPEGQAPAAARDAKAVRKPDAAEGREGAASAKNSAPADRVEISGRSKEIADIMSAVEELPEVRESKVQEIRERVDSGAYKVDPDRIAEKILRSI
jgi:negative regulator of flagellin synthesis FlgM